MSYSEKLANRVREALAHLKKVEEKRMFNGMCFMVNDKMCVCISNDELMCRIDPDMYDELVEQPGVRPMIMKDKLLKGYVYIHPDHIKKKSDFDYWIKLCLDFNPKAKSSKKK